MSLAYKKTGKSDTDHKAASRFTEIKDFGLTMTVQSPADEVDINKIMARVQKGQTVLTSAGEPFYGDVSEYGGLQEAIMKVQEAEDIFMQHPAEIREKFQNDPVQFVEFLADPENHDEARKLGLLKAKPVPEPVENPAPAPAPASGGGAPHS